MKMRLVWTSALRKAGFSPLIDGPAKRFFHRITSFTSLPASLPVLGCSLACSGGCLEKGLLFIPLDRKRLE